MTYFLHLLVVFSIYALLASSLNVLVGYTGLLSVAHAAFYGIGAYTSALLAIRFGWNFALCVLGGALVAAILSLLVSVPALRLRGDYFMLASLGFQMIVSNVLTNWTGLTRGPLGIPGVPRPSIFSLHLTSVPSFLVLAAFTCGICLLLLFRVLRSPFGLSLKTLREDEVAAVALGKNAQQLKIQAFVMSAVFCAIGGGLFASYATFIDPTSFSLNESLFILAVVLIGGSGNLRGPVIGAATMIAIPELLRFLQIPGSIASNIRLMLYGLLLVFLMRYRPQGIAGDYKFE